MNIIITDGKKKCKFTKVSKESVAKIYSILLAEYDTIRYARYCEKCAYKGFLDVCSNCKIDIACTDPTPTKYLNIDDTKKIDNYLPSTKLEFASKINQQYFDQYFKYGANKNFKYGVNQCGRCKNYNDKKFATCYNCYWSPKDGVHPSNFKSVDEKESSYNEKYDYCHSCINKSNKEICNECNQSHSYEMPSKWKYENKEKEDD